MQSFPISALQGHHLVAIREMKPARSRVGDLLHRGKGKGYLAAKESTVHAELERGHDDLGILEGISQSRVEGGWDDSVSVQEQ